MEEGGNQLVIIQPTPFCNIDCRYCYLPQRSNTGRMDLQTLEQVFSKVLDSKLIKDPIVFVWHLGEPLSVPPNFYRSAFELANRINNQYRRDYVHAFQTNGTLIDDEWITLIREHGVKLGISLDGPDFIHDRQRVSRTGKGTHNQVMRGIGFLHDAKIPFNIIMVLTNYALDYPDKIFNFFTDHNIQDIAFNIDEIEGINITSSFQDKGAMDRYKNFIHRLLDLIEQSPGRLRVREFTQILEILTSPVLGSIKNSTNIPLKIVNFDYKGNFSTFCPELLGMKSEKYQDFIMGNIMTDPIDNIFDNPVFKIINADIQSGVTACKQVCQYWDFCGGGSPSNKFFEQGRLDITETMSCRIHKKAIADVILQHLEKRLSQ